MIRRVKLAVYSIAKYTGLFAISRRVTAKFPRIICYHGGAIGDEWRYNGLLFITPEKFSMRICWLLKNGYQFATLDEVLENDVAKRFDGPVVTLTFDDGWHSTGSKLLPILGQNHIPSVLYLSTKYFLDGYPIIPVTLGYIFWKAKKREIEIRDFDVEINGIYDISVRSECIRLITKATEWANTKARDKGDVIEMLNRVAASSGVTSIELALNSRRFSYLTTEEILLCAKMGCKIELHGHIHRYPTGEPDVLREDLKKCANVIRELLLTEPKHYCYPSGGFDSLASKTLMESGIKSATTCISGFVDCKDMNSRYYLPRFLDGENVHMLEFESEMSGFSELLRRIVLPWRTTMGQIFKNTF